MKEKVDGLFKLGRSYINRKEKNDTEGKKHVEDKPDDKKNDDEVETISTEEVTN